MYNLAQGREGICRCDAVVVQAYSEVRRHAQREFSSLLDMKADLRQTALHQMLRLHSKKMFKVGSALNISDTGEAKPRNGSKDRHATTA